MADWPRHATRHAVGHRPAALERRGRRWLARRRAELAAAQRATSAAPSTRWAPSEQARAALSVSASSPRRQPRWRAGRRGPPPRPGAAEAPRLLEQVLAGLAGASFAAFVEVGAAARRRARGSPARRPGRSGPARAVRAPRLQSPVPLAGPLQPAPTQRSARSGPGKASAASAAPSRARARRARAPRAPLAPEPRGEGSFEPPGACLKLCLWAIMLAVALQLSFLGSARRCLAAALSSAAAGGGSSALSEGAFHSSGQRRALLERASPRVS